METPVTDREKLIDMKRHFEEWLKSQKNVTKEAREYHNRYVKFLSDRINDLNPHKHPWRQGYQAMPTGPQQDLYTTGNRQ